MKAVSLATATLGAAAAAAAVLAVAAGAQVPGRYGAGRDARAGGRPTVVNLTMTDDGFVPRRIGLRGGAPYVLHLANRSGKGHNFTQKAFFRLAGVAPEDRVMTRDGQISLPPGADTLVHFRAPDTRPGGTYQFSSTVLGDAASDYTGTFVIR